MIYTSEELKEYWPAKCDRCGWRRLSRDCVGGEPIADSGDYSDVECPECVKAAEKVIEEEGFAGPFPVSDDDHYYEEHGNSKEVRS